MSDDRVTVTANDEMNQIVFTVVRRLSEQESEWMRQALWEAWDDGFDANFNERERQRRDPNYALTRRNPWEKKRADDE